MYPHLPSPVTFREDINGLRAWAVIAVLLFHFSLIGLPGGFAGVDVFFVISGYLMTAIIVGGYEKGNFSIWKFYMARARRILPALMFMIAVLLVLGWFLLPTPDYQALGTQSAYGLTFLSNIYYWRSAGYFDAAAQDKWLLHTWSLAVEAQFYLLYPLFVAVVWRFWNGLKALTISLLILFMASLLLSIVVTFLKPTAAFYLLPTRSWELAAGGLVYLIARQGWVSERLKRSSYWLGWVFVIASFSLIEESFAWPGYWAILPVLGASLIILGHRENCKLTNNLVAQWLGDRSYSLYLWHWPLVVVLYFSGLQSGLAWVAGAFTLSLLLAHLSYEFVEVPTRNYLLRASLIKEFFALASAGVLIGVAALSIYKLGFSERHINQSPQAKYVSFYSRDNYLPLIQEAYMDVKCNFYDYGNRSAKIGIDASCVTDGLGGVFLWGDSHAQALSYGIRMFIEKNSGMGSFSQVASSGCRPHLTESNHNTGEFKKTCDRSNVYALNAIAKVKPGLVVLAQADMHTENNLPEIAEHLLELGVNKVLIVGPVPQWSIDLPRLIARHYWGQLDARIDDSHFKSHLLKVDKDLKQQVEKLGNPRIKYISIIDKLCEKKWGCVAILDSSMTPLAFDYGHLTKDGSVFVVNNVLASFLGLSIE